MRLVLTLPVGEVLTTGKQVTFEAPCGSEGLNEISVNGVTYDLVDAEGNSLVDNSFNAEAMVSVIFNVEKKKAFVQNADTNAYLEDRLSQAYVKEATGEIICISDSANAPVHSLSVCGKTTQITTVGNQLVDFSKGSPTSGVTYSFENDILTVIGDGTSGYQHVQFIVLDIIKNNAGKSIYFSFEDLTYERESRVFCQIVLTKTDDTKIYSSLINSNGAQVAYPIPNDVSDIVSAWIGVYVNNSAELFTNTVTIVKPMLQFSTAKLTYEPYSGGKASPSPDYPQDLNDAGNNGSIEVSAYGKNLFKPKYFVGHTETIVGVKFTVNSSGIITFSGTTTAACTIILMEEYLKNTKGLFVKAPNLTNMSLLCRVADDNNAGKISYLTVSNVGLRLAPGQHITRIYTQTNNVGVAVSGTVYPQVVIGDTDTDYEPYKGGYSFSINTPGLPGIPVVSGGNYTDENGQQWICDEIDFSRGVYIQRVRKYTFSTEVFTLHPKGMLYSNCLVAANMNAITAVGGLCNRLTWTDNNTVKGEFFCVGSTGLYIGICDSWSTPAELSAFLQSNETYILYPLVTPVETSLNSLELLGYDSLFSTNDPNTTVLNSGNAYMKLKYYTPVSALPESGGRMSGDIDMWGNRLRSVAPPQEEGDAVNLQFLNERSPYVESGRYPGCFFRPVYREGSTLVEEEEWVNPPMIAGEEYRTTERWKNEVVYTKLLEFDALPNNGDLQLVLYSELEAEAKEVVSVDGFVYSANSGKYKFPFPVFNNVTGIADAVIDIVNFMGVSIHTYSEDMSRYGGGVVKIKYTKQSTTN